MSASTSRLRRTEGPGGALSDCFSYPKDAQLQIEQSLSPGRDAENTQVRGSPRDAEPRKLCARLAESPVRSQPERPLRLSDPSAEPSTHFYLRAGSTWPRCACAERAPCPASAFQCGGAGDGTAQTTVFFLLHPTTPKPESRPRPSRQSSGL